MLAASGCATYPARDPALDDARLSLDAARRNPQVAIYAPAELDQAAAALRQADDLAARGGRYSDVHELALLARQRAMTAQDVARLRSEQAALDAQRNAADARIRASVSQQQAAAAQVQAAEAQRRAEEAQRLAGAPPTAYTTPSSAYDYRRRDNEPLYEAQVTSVRAVVGPPEQRCWVERQAVDSGTAGMNVPGAIVGGIAGGVLGHQIGSGRGQDVATGIGAAAGALVGANVGRDAAGTAYTQDVHRCTTLPASTRPDYWDVTYTFRGYEHRVQTATPPGSTILVNAQGEPRI
jgi:uncharacterized protein YcfJ